jgi:hypothetical protein
MILIFQKSKKNKNHFTSINNSNNNTNYYYYYYTIDKTIVIEHCYSRALVLLFLCVGKRGGKNSKN